ncbi:MAG: M14 family metallopeptidase [Gammaproteobacteria bacterium]|nr:M14 family metallopeptidase [Gammaproteobacteria bacterium]
MTNRLHIHEGLPAGLTDCDARTLAHQLGGPSLIHVPGHCQPPLLVSVLLHGNETSGWEGVRRLLAELPASNARLPRSLILFIGNVEAAAAGVRTLPHQQDFNRIWGGAQGPEGELAREVLAALAGRTLFAAVDLHNNTGQNPHYAVVTNLQRDNLGLAYLFDDKAVYVREPATVMTRSFADRCPAIALELGPIGDPRCDDRAFDYVKRCLNLQHIPPPDPARLQMFRTEARVHIADGVPFSFAGEDESFPLVLTGGLEAVNFHDLAAGTEFAVTRYASTEAFRVLDVQHRDVTARYFALAGSSVLLRQSVIPAMYTTDPLVIRQDCLCYFMERMPLTLDVVPQEPQPG